MENHIVKQNATTSFPPFFHDRSFGEQNAPSPSQALVERIINDLNLRYNLELPRTSTVHAGASGKQEEVLARSCSEFIELLAFQRHRVYIPDVIQDFEEWARPVLMKWVPKKQQEKGTLVSQSIECFNHENAVATASSFTPEQRHLLLKELERRLHEECKLIGDSEVYSRSSKLPKDSTFNTKMSSSQPKVKEPSTPRIDMSLKRKKPSSAPDDLFGKRQSPSTNRSAPGPFFPGNIERVASSESKNPATSFSTTASSTIPDVFTQSNVTEPISNATSFVDVDDDNTQSTDLFPSQEALELENDEEFRRSFAEACKDGVVPDTTSLPRHRDAVALVESLEKSGPFRLQEISRWRQIPFRNRYELQRIAGSLNMLPEHLLLRMDGKEPDLLIFWQNARSLASSQKKMLPEKSSLEAWSSAEGTFQHESGSSVTLSGSLCWTESPDQGLFRLQLQPLKLERSCRFHRRFGADRFLLLYLPSLSARHLPPDFANPSEVKAAVSDWLARSTHHFLGREWRAFYVEEDKRQSKKSTPRGFKAHLFAVDGFDFAIKNCFPSSDQRSENRTALKVHELLNWQLRVSDNLHSTNCKLFQRIALGLSKTYPTISFEQGEFIHVPGGEPEMSDGCARISMSAAKRISERLGLLNVPSVFQGRIAGAKGVWMVDYDENFLECSNRQYAIEVSDSQLKVHPHPRYSELDIDQRTFEVSGWSRSPRTASLTKQFLSILEAQGVSKDILEKALQDETHFYFESLKESARDPLLLRIWLQISQRYARSPAGIRCLGAWPDEDCEQAIQFVESGFLPDDCSTLRELLRKFLKEYFDRYIEKLAISVPRSTDVYCIADPFGILAENEIHLGFSENWRDERSGFTDTIVDGIDVLVARSPALLPSDIQRRRASWKRELRHFKDVAVFSTKGDTALASFLSGGDYDGDRVVVIWDQSFVSNFQNAELPNDKPSLEACHVVNVSQKLSTMAHGLDPATVVDEILSSCFQFNLEPSLLGICNTEHEKLVYNTGTISSKDAIFLATLAGHLVDRSKQGLSLSEDGWEQVRAEVHSTKLSLPAYKQDNPSKIKPTNVIDYLKFHVTVLQKEAKLTEFAKLWPENRKPDQELMRWWKEANSVARKERKDHGDPRLHEILTDLSSNLDQVLEEWRKKSAVTQKAPVVERQYPTLIQNLFEQVRDISPCHKDHPLIAACEWEKENARWNFIRASCLYTKQQTLPTRFVWYMVGQDLCCLKLSATEGVGRGLNRAVSSRIYLNLQVNVKLARRVKNLEVEELEIGDIGEQIDDDDLGDE